MIEQYERLLREAGSLAMGQDGYSLAFHTAQEGDATDDKDELMSSVTRFAEQGIETETKVGSLQADVDSLKAAVAALTINPTSVQQPPLRLRNPSSAGGVLRAPGTHGTAQQEAQDPSRWNDVRLVAVCAGHGNGATVWAQSECPSRTPAAPTVQAEPTAGGVLQHEEAMEQPLLLRIVRVRRRS